jgi:prophage regulatory protein
MLNVTTADQSARKARRGTYQSLEAAALPGSLLRIATVCERVGLSVATIYRKLDEGKFPQPVRLGKRCTRWKSESISAWVNAQRASL